MLSRDEHDPDGLVVAKQVEEVFERNGLIRELRIAGRTIRSTGEHPFHRRGDGWVPLGAIRVGDRLLGEDGRWLTVEGVRDTGGCEPVYNVRVADFHTYFVGEQAWGWAVWAHNNNGCVGAGYRTQEALDGDAKCQALKAQYHGEQVTQRAMATHNALYGEESTYPQLLRHVRRLVAESLMSRTASGIRYGRYGTMSGNVPGQMHHANQDGAFRLRIPTDDATAIQVFGEVFGKNVDVNSRHFRLHQ